MNKIKFIKNDTELFVQLSKINDRIICTFIKDDFGDIKEDMFSEGFMELNEHNNIEQGEYQEYKYVYKVDTDCNSYILTKDADDKYIEPIETPITETPHEEYIPSLDEVKKQKINSLSYICNKKIVDGVDVAIDGETEHFSYKDEDQVNIKELFDLATQSKVALYYHADGLSCKLYTVEEIIDIYTSNAINKMHHITYFNQLKLYIESLDDIDSVKEIEYGDELSGDYLSTYNEAMKQAELGMNTLLGA